MTEKEESYYSMKSWDQLMGRELPRSESQPLQPVMIENGKLKLFAEALNSRFSTGAKIGLRLNGNHIVFQEVSDGNPLQEASFWNEGRIAEFKLPEAIREVLPEEDPVFAILLDTGEHLELLPMRVQEHDPDVLGPRIIDEIEESTGETRAIVRHIIKSFEYEDWTIERLKELEELICSKPYHSSRRGLEPLRNFSLCSSCTFIKRHWESGTRGSLPGSSGGSLRLLAPRGEIIALKTPRY